MGGRGTRMELFIGIIMYSKSCLHHTVDLTIFHADLGGINQLS